ncbi:kinesin-like protein KIF12 isoform X1 [Dermatophagoides farinae]|uniref:kinesin-like protein KIF12 isoform X1 n=2 Tax=Dermatophagoides farinae TaxID=6954 RepID=UPI003F60C9AF
MFNDNEMINDSSLLNQSSSSSSSSSPGQNEHNINVVIRVRPIITRPRTSTSLTTTTNNNNSSNLNKLISQRAETTTTKTSTINSTTTTTTDQRQQYVNGGGGEIDAHHHQQHHQLTAITFPAAGQIQVEDTIANVSRSFAFNVVFEPEASQEQVFEHSGVKRLIDMALDGFACTVFAYGQTSTGKTYTLTGNAFQFARYSSAGNSAKKTSSSSSNKRRSKSQPPDSINESLNIDETMKNSSPNIGIIQLSFAYLFEQIKRRKSRDQTLLYIITVSYLEVYNEQVLDLLNPSTRSLNVRWSKDRGFYAENLFKVECEDLGDLEGVLEEGCKNRQVRSHSMNENSSRSHSVMTINLFSEIADPDDPQGFIRKEGRLCLVDLAGSEKTKRTNSKGGTFVEANNINRSLLVLGNCIACLADPKRRTGHIPYRDSTLTKLLADSLSGNGMTLMIACVSSLKCDSQETISTLRYASRAKRVRMNPVVQMDPRELLILSLKREVRMLRMENQYLRQNCHQMWSIQQPLQQSMIDSSEQFSDKNQSMDNDEQQNLLRKYMKENEVLRVENVQINLQRNRLVRDHELVCRENEQLLRKLNLLLYKLNSFEKNGGDGDSVPTTTMLVRPQLPPPSSSSSIKSASTATTNAASNLYSSSSSPSILSILAYDDADNNNLNENDSDIINDDGETIANNPLMDQYQRSSSSKTTGNMRQIVSSRPTATINSVNGQITTKTLNDRDNNDGNDDGDGQFLDLTIHGRSAVTVIHPKSSSKRR